MSDSPELDEALEKRNRKTDEALEEYQSTGQYVSHETMDTWLKTWGTGRENQCPTSSQN